MTQTPVKATELVSASECGTMLRRTRSLDVVVIAICSVASIVLFLLFSHLRHDDAYITFQYARNLALGHGLVFNIGERVLGTTTPLFTLLMALIYLLFGDVLPQAAIGISAAAVGLQGWFLYQIIVSEDGHGWAGVTVCVLTVVGLAGSASHLALETNLFAALVLGCSWALIGRRSIWAGIFLGLAFLCRYDAGLLIAIVVAWTWIRQRRWPVVSLLISFAIVAPWLLFATFYFGSALPNTLSAKAGLVPFWQYIGHYAELFVRLPIPQCQSYPWFCRAVGTLLLLAGVYFTLTRAREVLPFSLFALLLLLVYAWIGPYEVQHWHLYPAVLAARVLMVLGLVGWTELVPHRSVALGTIAAALVCTIAIGWKTVAFAEESKTAFWLGERHRRYEIVAKWVNEHARPAQVFMSREVGTLGYLTTHRMIDPYGLINPTNEWPKTKSPAALIELVRHYKPDIVLFDSPEQARVLGQLTGLRLTKVFPWKKPWSSLAVRRHDLLRNP